ncbi:hypothetical protein AUC45_08820 [Erythrobacter sp. YT30]|nr:hypothetical protein AUC45_08820 [Erythrobacter sp. YT30]
MVIVNWNSGPFLNDCLQSIEQYSDGLVASVTVVDNASTDGSFKSAECRPRTKLIHAGQNLGFGKGCNVGANEGNSKYILFLNPDARLLPDTLRTTHEFMEQDENSHVGISGVQLIDHNQNLTRSCSRFPSALGLVFRSTGFEKIFPSLGIRMVDWNHIESREVDQVMGAYFFIRRSLFQSLLGFDERFFVYYEEVDLSKRANELGLKSFYLANAQAVHFGGGSSEHIKARRLFYSLRSRLNYCRKHFGPWSMALVLASTLIIEPGSRTLKAIINRNSREFWETVTAYRMLVFSLLNR